jgi:hypothetical protein
MRDLYESEVAELKKEFPIIRKRIGNKIYVKVFENIDTEYDYIINTKEYEPDMKMLIAHLNNLMPKTQTPTRFDTHDPWLALHILTNIIMEI